MQQKSSLNVMAKLKHEAELSSELKQNFPLNIMANLQPADLSSEMERNSPLSVMATLKNGAELSPEMEGLSSECYGKVEKWSRTLL